MTTEFQREDRYVVLKRSDIEAHVNVADVVVLNRIAADINTGRAGALKQPLRCLVIESDWPEFEPACSAIAARTRGLNEPSGDSGQLPALPVLWCLHLVGPDDVHPAPSKAHAELAAKKLNDWFAQRPKTEHTPHFEAVAAPWPHSAESHAASVEQFIPEFLLPTTQQPAISEQTDLRQFRAYISAARDRSIDEERCNTPPRSEEERAALARARGEIEDADRLLALIDG